MQFKGTSGKKWIGVVIGILLVSSLGVFLKESTIDLGLKNSSYDLLMISRGEIPASNNVALVYLDERSHELLEQPLNLPWDRSIHAQLIDRLTELGARRIVFDIVFSDPGIRGPEVDNMLASSIAKSGQVILAADEVLKSHKVKVIDMPILHFQTNALGIGTADLSPSQDLVVRRFTRSDPNADIRSLATITAQLDGTDVTKQDRWINYYGRPLFLPWMSYADVFNPNTAQLTNNIFDGKVVFVGAKIFTKFAGDRKDEYPNPFTWKGAEADGELFMPGVEVQASAFLNLIRGDWLRRLPPLIESLVIALIGCLLGVGLLYLRPWAATGAAVAAAILTIVVSNALFRSQFIWFPFLIIVVQIGLALLWSIVFNSIQLYVQKRLLEQTIAIYLPPKLVKKFAKDPKWLKPGAEESKLTIMFSDIANFTSFSEGLPADELANFMNGYFQEAVNNCIHTTEGTVVKYIGDAIFAFWNAPEEQSDHAIRACKAAVIFRNQGTYEINGQPVFTRIGLHTGVANVGNFGSTERVDYTAFGESINLASRMEGLNKHLGTTLVITGATKALIGNEFTTRFVGQFRLKGFEKPVAVYELIGLRSEADVTREWRHAFADALTLYKAKNFDEAEPAFLRVLDLHANDGPSKFYLNKIAEWRAGPVPLSETLTDETHMTEK